MLNAGACFHHNCLLNIHCRLVLEMAREEHLLLSFYPYRVTVTSCETYIMSNAAAIVFMTTLC